MKTTLLNLKSKIVLLILMLFIVKVSKAQDTIYTVDKKKIAAKVLEIGLNEIKFKLYSNLEGPTVVIRKVEVKKIKYTNGTEMAIIGDKYDVNKEKEILNMKSSYKFQPLGLTNHHFTIGYERMLTVGTNLEVKVGFIKAEEKKSQDWFTPGVYRQRGFFVKPGIKFLLGSDIIIDGMRYAHPLKGRYLKFELDYTQVRYFDVPQYNNYNNYFYYSNNTYTVKTDEIVTSQALHLIYGRQYILGNVMTVDFFVGIGGSAVQVKYTNATNQSEVNTSRRTNLYSHIVLPSKISFCGGIAIGFIGK